MNYIDVFYEKEVFYQRRKLTLFHEQIKIW